MSRWLFAERRLHGDYTAAAADDDVNDNDETDGYNAWRVITSTTSDVVRCWRR